LLARERLLSRALRALRREVMGRDKDQQPASDTATDWDEWMERHAERPRPVPDAASAEGRFTPDKSEPIPVTSDDDSSDS
jgi:hypothetical protein